jgi:imidazolonepropionase-like amidohydrolase
MKILILFIIHCSLYSNTQVPADEQKRPILLRGGTLHTVANGVLNETDILFSEGKIITIDQMIKPSPETDVYDIYGKHVVPGFIAAYTRIGLTEISAVKQTNDHSEVGEINPNVRANVTYNTDSDLISITRSNGILTINSVPASGLIPGQSSVMALDGWTWEDATMKHPAALHLNWPNMYVNFDKKLKKGEKSQDEIYLETHRQLDKLILNVKSYYQRKNAKERKAEHKQKSDLRLESMIPFIIFQEPIHIKANDIRQIEAAINWSNKHNLNIVIVGGNDAWINPEILVSNNVPVILLGVQKIPSRRYEPIHKPYMLPSILHKAGVRFCISLEPGYPMDGHVRTLPDEAMKAYSWGLDKNEALRSITLSAAEILGVDEYIGSLEAGKDATFFISETEPLLQKTNPFKAYIKGKELDLSDRQKNLLIKYKEKYRRLGKLKD